MCQTGDKGVEWSAVRRLLAEPNAIDLLCVARENVPSLIAIIKRIDSRGQSVLQIARHSVEITVSLVKSQTGLLAECFAEQ
jgi:hypothetical protein